MTINCCLISRLAGTTRGIPESVSPPNITAQGPETLRLSWSVPEKTKDVIKEDQLWLDGRGLISADTGDSRQHTVTGDKTGNLLEEAVIAVGLWGEPPRGVCLIYEVTSKGHVLLTYGQVLLKPC